MIGKEFSHYRILEQLGAGGMGVVYKALDTKLNRHVALKFLPRALSFNPDLKQRFKIEAQSAAALNHPNIATIHSTEEVDSEAFIVMEYLEGQELSDKIKEGNIDLTSALDITIQIAKGLGEAHSRGIIHRDIKSANVMITKSGLVKVMDFGLAKLAGSSMITQMGTTLGTINYMSPEQSRGENVDYRTDLWSLGVILYEMLTGKPPFRGDYEQAVIYSILNEPPKPINLTDAPPQLQLVVDKLLHKIPDERYQSAGELVKDLKKIKTSIETGVPIDLIDSKEGITKYITQIKTSAILPVKKKKVVPIAAIVIIMLVVIIALLRGNDVLKIFGVVNFASQRHIAILPFINIGNDKKNQAFCDGLMETLTNKTSRFEQFADQLWVVPASEIRKSNITSVREAYDLFGVNLVLTGSVEPIKSGYRVNINLVDSESLRQRSTRKIDDPMTSTSFIQDEIVIKVAEMLNLELKPENIELLSEGKSDDPKAYELYLKGKGSLTNYDDIEMLENAVNYFNQAIQLDSSFVLAYSGLGEAYMWKYLKNSDIRWIETAILNCNKAVALNETLNEVRLTLGRVLEETGKYIQAAEEYQKVLERDPSNIDAYIRKANALLSMGNCKEAEILYKKAIEKRPNYILTYQYLGILYYKEGNFLDAAAQFKTVTSLTPNNPAGYRNLGAINYFLGQTDAAIESFKKALSIKPDYPTYNNLATIYVTEGKFEDAAHIFEQILQSDSTDYRVWGHLADTYYRIPGGKIKSIEANTKAIELAEEKSRINPNDPDLMVSLSSYYGMIGDKLKSSTVLRKLESMEIIDFHLQYLIGEIYEEWHRNRKKALEWIKLSVKNGYPVDEIDSIYRPGLKNFIKDKEFRAFIDSLNQINS
jgi:serine/threonine-protein kinase